MKVEATFDTLPERGPKRKAVVLIIGATPKDQGHLDVDVEVNQIKAVWRESQLRDHVEVEYEPAVLVSQLHSHLQRFEPTILHFAGHGETHGILVEKADGTTQVISNEALVGALKLYRKTLRCVVLNACYSEELAQMLASELGIAVGMVTAVGDQTAIKFARGFYRAICNGRDVQFAFESGCNEVDLESLRGAKIPQLRYAVDPATLVLVQPVKEDAMSKNGNDIDINGNENVVGDGNVVQRDGGVNFGGSGNVTVGGDVIGRDKITQGDSINVGNITGSSGIAIGSGASATVTTTTYYGTPDDRAKLNQLLSQLETALKQVGAGQKGDAADVQDEIDELKEELDSGSPTPRKVKKYRERLLEAALKFGASVPTIASTAQQIVELVQKIVK